MMVSFIDENRNDHGVEPICQQLPMAPSTYYNHKARAANLERLPKRVKRDWQLETEIRRVYEDNFRVYGARKVWRQMTLEGIEVARCTVERLMKRLGLQGVRRGAKRRTTISDASQQRPLDLVNRQFIATRPNQLWVDRYYLCGHLVWFCLCGFCHRRLCPLYRRLAGQPILADRSSTGCPGTSALVT